MGKRGRQTTLRALVLLLLGWLGQAVAAAPPAPVAPVLAPEFPAGLQWLNTARPLTLRALRGNVVLLDFWTYGCINCLHILPDLHRLQSTYARHLVVIGVHSAKYDNEAALANIRQAVRRYGITHPVVNDRALQIWKAYRVPGWPTQIVIDPEGRQLQGFVGEHHGKRLDDLIRSTIALHRRKGTLRNAPTLLPKEPHEGRPTPLHYPAKVLADAASSRLFIADTQHHRLVVTDFQGNLQAVIGRGVAGNQDGTFEQASFRQPQGMALQGTVLYVADTANHVVRRVDLQRRVVDTIVGTGGQAREWNVPGYGRTVPLNSPWDLSLQAPYLYIAMAGMHQIWRWHLTTGYAEPFAGSGHEDLVDGPHSEAALGQPSGLSGDGQRLYIADSEVNAIRAASVDPRGMVTTLAGGGLFTFGDRDGPGEQARLQHPLGVAYADRFLYVADTYNHKLKVLDVRQGLLHTYAGTGVAGYRDGALAQAQFYEPGGISSADGRLYVADTNNHCIRVIDRSTRTVSTLPLRGLRPPIGAAEPEPDGNRALEVVRLKEQPLRAASPAAIRLAFDLPEGWKINTAAPATLAVVAQGDGVQIPASYTNQTLQPFDPDLAIPLAVASAGTRSQLRIDLTFVICRLNDQGICALRQIAWEVPVRSQAQAQQSELTLRYGTPSFQGLHTP